MDATIPAMWTQTPRDFAPLRLRLYPSGHVIDITQPDVVLGRHTSADLRMPLPDISRRHCRFRYATAGWELHDLDSLNGIYVNGERVHCAVLHPGDHVRICGLEFEVDAPIPDIEVLRSIAERLPHRKAS
ncbi:MAG: FHA domain-containing protein [Gemmataceae bacterium]